MAERRTKTPWFTKGQRPARAGVYQVRWNVFFGMDPEPTVCIAYAYWSRRKGWCQPDATPRGALRRNHYSHPAKGPHWRGLTKESQP